MTREYRVTVHGKYDFVKRDDNIKECRAWARRAFPGETVTVQQVERPYRFCGDCQSAPCCCMVRGDV